MNGKLNVGRQERIICSHDISMKNDPIIRAKGIESFILHIVEYTDSSKSAILSDGLTC